MTTISNYTDLNSIGELESGLLNGQESTAVRQGAPLVFKDINVTLKSGRKILSSINGVIKPGKLVGILGASGAGKSTLLNVLCGRISIDAGGYVKLAGRSVADDDVRHSISYCMQEDLFIGTLTVREHLQFTARLRMNPSIPYATKMARVEQVINQLGLTKSANTIIGTKLQRGLSGGEQKRLSFASDLLNDPVMFCADEPTSGLDSYMAEGVVDTLKLLAKQGKTVLATIHQPSPEVFSVFDEVIFLAEGKVAYFGPTSELVSFLSKTHSLECPLYTNPADFAIKVLSTQSRDGNLDEVAANVSRVKKITDTWALKQSQEGDEEIVRTINMAQNMPFEGPTAAGWFLQLWVMTIRSYTALLRDTMQTAVRFAQSVVLALVAGAIYWQIGKNDMQDPQTLRSVGGALFFIITNQGFSGLFGVLQAFPIELPVFLREYSSGAYRVDTYYLSKILAELPFQILFPIIFSAIVYPMLGLWVSFDKFLVFCLAIILCAQAAMGLGYMVSTAAGSVNVALAVGPIAILPIMLFGGLYISLDQIPSFLRWLKDISFFKYTFEILGINQFRGNAFALELYAFNENDYMSDFYWLIGLALAFRFLSFVFLFLRARSATKIKTL